MDYYFLDLVSWQDSQALYHAACDLGREALFILRPSSPYVCLGFHQDARVEVDLDFAQAEGIPVFRREVGGGAVYLDSGQLFYQLVLRKNHPAVPADKAAFYEKFLAPVVETYRAFGVPAVFKPVNDIIANGRKVSGNGAAEIGDCVVLVGNFLLDFNFEMMAKILRVPDEKFRDKVYKTLQENLSTIQRETGAVPETADLAQALVARLEPLLGPMEARDGIDAALRARADERIAFMNTPEWLYANDQRASALRKVKIREGVDVIQNVHKAPGGLIRVSAVSVEGVLTEVHISGDFFFYPQEALVELERSLEGAPAEPEALAGRIEAFFERHGVEAPGISAADLAEAFA